MANNPSPATPSKSETEALSAQIDTLKRDVGAIMETLKTIAGDRVDTASQRARHAATDAQRAGEQAARQAQEAIAENPFTALMIALGLGFLIGSMIRR